MYKHPNTYLMKYLDNLDSGCKLKKITFFFDLFVVCSYCCLFSSLFFLSILSEISLQRGVSIKYIYSIDMYIENEIMSVSTLICIYSVHIMEAIN